MSGMLKLKDETSKIANSKSDICGNKHGVCLFSPGIRHSLLLIFQEIQQKQFMQIQTESTMGNKTSAQYFQPV